MQLHQVHSDDETIVARSTPEGRSGIGVVRVSGPRAFSIMEQLFRSRDPFQDRRARYGSFGFPGKDPIDRVVVTAFQAPHSYTGQDIVEVSAHGNPVILNAIIDAMCASGARRAGPGEFTLRAVTNGKMDLAQAEAVGDFIQAQTEAQARSARLQMEGGLAKRLRPSKMRLLEIIAELEAGIDFAEDDVDVPDSLEAARVMSQIAERLTEHAATFDYGRLLNQGVSVVIVGKPNVGKSCLFNRLIAMDRSIVTDIAGTTRDLVTETVTVGDLPVRFADTAGIRKTEEAVEAMGVTRTAEALAEADLVLAVLDASRELDVEDIGILERIRDLPHIVVVNKDDLPKRWDAIKGRWQVRVSARTGMGLDELRTALCAHFTNRRPADEDSFLITSVRQQETLAQAAGKLRHAAEGCCGRLPHEVVLVDLYGAMGLLGELTGEVVSDDILDRIFSTFCVGK